MSPDSSRGSEWYKWDLHFHTPVSPDYKDKSATNEQIIDSLVAHEIKVVVVTDHNFIDVDKIKGLQTEGAKKSMTVLPGIELRGEYGKEPINYIGIFPEDADLEFIRNELYSKLDLTKKRKENTSEDALYCAIEKGCKEIHDLGGIVSVHAGKKSNSIECIPNTLPSSMAQKKDIASWVDIFELGSASDADDYTNIVFTKLEKVYPMIVASDNHDHKSYAFKGNNYCWIKAKPTFLGLKQIIYEPNDRIKIQELRPEEKSPQSIINYVSYSSTNGETRTVAFNQNLNSLIGSRAQGKSNLLRNMAYSIDYDQSRNRGVSDNEFLPLKDFKVVWSDNSVNTLLTTQDKDKGVLFIPQKYLGELIYDKNPKFDKFLTNLFENNVSFSNGLGLYKKFEDTNSLEIASSVQSLLDTRSWGADKSEKIKKLGKKESYETEIQDIQNQIKGYGKTAQISEEELKSYNEISSDIKKNELDSKALTRDIESLKRLKSLDIITAENIDIYDFTDKTFKKITDQLSASDKDFKESFIIKELRILNTQVTKLESEMKALTTKVKPLEEKIKKSQALVSLTKRLTDKKSAKLSIEQLEKERAELGDKYKKIKDDLLAKYKLYETTYNSLDIEIDKLDFSEVKITVVFDEDSFRKFLDENINYHNSIEFRKVNSGAKKLLDSPIAWHYETSKFQDLLRDLLDGIMSQQLLLKSGKDVKSVITDLVKNRFKIDFLKSVTRGGVSFTDMSDGEQMLALLEFIFKFDSYKYPVLLDQPEDDLDAKAISSTIVEFIKSEKAERQIIIASHNANLVVCGDSENIIVSSKTGGKNPDFKYVSGAIEEDSVNKEIVEILEGGKQAFERRRNKLGIA